MLKAIVNYSKKVPVPDSEYSSQGYSLSLEAEIPESDPAAIQARLHDTFELVKSSVERELATAGAKPAKPTQPQPPVQPQAPRQDDERASNRQVKFITDLASRNGVGLPDLNAEIRDTYGVNGLYDLSRKQASALLDRLKAGTRKAA
jgi:hypothetical protein